MKLSNGPEGEKGRPPRVVETSGSLPACFERVAAANRRRPALVSDHWQWTYDQLNATANRLAHAIAGHGGAPGQRVAILMPHDAPAIASLIAVLKAGCIVVALDPRHPIDRLRELIADSEPTLILADAGLKDLGAEIAGLGRQVLLFEEHGVRGPDHNPAIDVSPRELVKLAYTSGSSGRPKAVMQTHRQIGRNVQVASESMQLTANDRMPLFGLLSGGQGVNVACCALLNGIALLPFPIAVRGVSGLADWMSRRNVTIFASTTSVFRNFMRTLAPEFRFSGIRVVRVGGESATADDFKLFQTHFSQDCWFVHTLTSTEASNIAWSRRLAGDRVAEGRLPIGAVSDGQEILILDENDAPVTPGEVGEIVVCSQYVAKGYWRRPELTAERFSEELDAAGTRRVRTGDLGRINASNMLEFCGRRDDRVKVRGHRIELAEIAKALQRLKGVEHAVIEAIPRAGREPLLVGFLTVGGGQSWTQWDLRRALRTMLPDYMVPAEFEVLPSFPLTPSGKIDRESLRRNFQPLRRPRSAEPPISQTESLLARIWSEVFEIGNIGREDDFFALGGDSLIGMLIAAKLHESIGIELDLGAFVEHPSLAGLAAFVDDVAKKSCSPTTIKRVSRTAPLPLSHFQEHVWRATQGDPSVNTSARSYRLVGSLDVDLLRDCMTDLMRRHEMLRTSFVVVDQHPMQIVHEWADVPLKFIDLSGAPDPSAEAGRLIRREAVSISDLSRPPLFYFVLVRVNEREHYLLRVNHHILSDGQCWNIYFRDLARLYEAKRRGDEPPLQAGPLQYADFAAWQRETPSSVNPPYAEQIAWWREQFFDQPLPVDLPFRRAKPIAANPADGTIRFGVEGALTRRLGVLAREEKATYYMLRLAAFAAVLVAETGNRDVVIGTYFSNRHRSTDREMFGVFLNLVTIILRCGLTETFRQWLSVVRDRVLDVQMAADVPYDQLRNEMARQHVQMPEIRVLLNVAPPKAELSFADLSLVPEDEIQVGAQKGVVFKFNERDEQLNSVTFDSGEYDTAGVDRFAQRFVKFLDAAAAEPDKPMFELFGLSADHVMRRTLDQLDARQRALLDRIRFIEEDLAARLDQIHALTSLLDESRRQGIERLEQVATLTRRLNEAHRAAGRTVSRPLLVLLVSRLKKALALIRARRQNAAWRIGG